MQYFAVILFVAFVAQPSHQRHVFYNDAQFEPEAYIARSDADGVEAYNGPRTFHIHDNYRSSYYDEDDEDIEDGQEYELREQIRKRAPVARPVPEETSQYNPDMPVDALNGAGLQRFQNEEVFQAMLEEVIREHLWNHQQRRNPFSNIPEQRYRRNPRYGPKVILRASREVLPAELDRVPRQGLWVLPGYNF